MSNPRMWSATAYLGVGLALGAVMAYAFIMFAELPVWAEIAIGVLVPICLALFAVVIREEIFFLWFV